MHITVSNCKSFAKKSLRGRASSSSSETGSHLPEITLSHPGCHRITCIAVEALVIVTQVS